MKKYIITTLFPLLLISCKGQTVYVPVESVRTEYLSRIERDSIHHYDSIFVREKGDTLWIEKYKYIYRDRWSTDTLSLNDTIRIPYPVVEIKEVNRLSTFQSFQLWCGRIGLLILILLLGAKYLKNKI